MFPTANSICGPASTILSRTERVPWRLHWGSSTVARVFPQTTPPEHRLEVHPSHRIPQLQKSCLVPRDPEQPFHRRQKKPVIARDPPPTDRRWSNLFLNHLLPSPARARAPD